MALIRPVFLLLLFLLLSVAFAAVATTLDAAAASPDTDWGLASTDPEEDFEEETAPQTCGTGNSAGECSSAAIGGDDDDGDEGDDATVEATDAEEGANVSRRGLAGAYPAGRTRFISYGALMKNRVPCSRRGHSYYNCRRRRRANPYRRGCSIITRCARILH